MAIFLFACYLAFTLIVFYHAWSLRIWEAGSIVYLLVTTFLVIMPWFCTLFLWIIIGGLIALLHIPIIQTKFSDFVYKKALRSIPKLSSTEEEALNAGDVWLEKDIFTGNLNWNKLSNINTELSQEEQSFLDNEVQNLCAMLDDWQISQIQDLPESVWTFLKEKGFLGLVISKEYGGKGFSARAHSDIVMKIASHCGTAAVTVMVPNSLGPGELLHYYGTKEQKNKYLPNLAKGIDIPCFALTEPGAGSDATSLASDAIVVKKEVDGKSGLYLHILSLDKRWITLAPVATLIGLAVNLKDPDKLLKGKGMEGITCLLIPRDTENLEIGNRHLPAHQPFMNGTIRGKDIFVQIGSIIGGQENAGRGWQMLVECLSIGRSISLPALAGGSSSVAYIGTGAFARIRRQFNVEIGQFEGVEEKLAEIAGLNYMINATRLLTVAAVNNHKKPSVASAITKYFNTELARIVINNAMDIHGGRMIVLGPRNYLMSLYDAVPISITVEGANIMSRNLLIFGQGSMANHPFIREEFYAITKQDKPLFEQSLYKHIRYFLQNFAKTLCTTWTGGYLINAPKNPLRREYQRLARLSYAFAFIADFCLVYLGGQLKRRERLSARLADALSYLYIAMASLKLYQGNKDNADEKLHAHWAVGYCFYHAQKALLALCKNFPSKPLGWLLRLIAFPLGQTMCYPKDMLGQQLAQSMMTNNAYRDSIKKAIYIDAKEKHALGEMEAALQLMIKNTLLYTKISNVKRYNAHNIEALLLEKVQSGELTADEMQALLAGEKARWEAIQVDEYSLKSVKERKPKPV